jgi:GDP-L-fucose synthase
LPTELPAVIRWTFRPAGRGNHPWHGAERLAGGEHDVTIRELAETIADVVGWKGEIRWDSSKPNGTPRKLMDVSKMSELGWSAQTSLRQGIEKTWKWYREHGPDR